jgi:molybdopterin molybdotransferase
MTSPLTSKQALLLGQAWDELAGLITPLDAETVAVDDAAGRILGEDIVARRTQPSHDLSAMDGFAIAGEGPWKLVGESRAGTPFSGSLSSAEAVQISTGAHCPPGTRSVLIAENAQVDGDIVRAAEEPETGRHIRRKGFDFTEGERVLTSGTKMGAAQMALARAAGFGDVLVARRPKVAVLECGDELVSDPQDCPPDRLPASNGAMLAALARSAGAIVQRVGPVKDTSEAMNAAFNAAGGADLIVTSGGASVGKHDLVKPVLEARGAKLAFWKVAIRPGKPLLVAFDTGNNPPALVLGLPGNPVSTYVTAFLFMLPAIRRFQGDQTALPEPIFLPSADDLPKGKARQEFLRGSIIGGSAKVLEERDSSALGALATATILIDRPIDAPPVTKGTPVPVYLLP